MNLSQNGEFSVNLSIPITVRPGVAGYHKGFDQRPGLDGQFDLTHRLIFGSRLIDHAINNGIAQVFPTRITAQIYP